MKYSILIGSKFVTSVKLCCLALMAHTRLMHDTTHQEVRAEAGSSAFYDKLTRKVVLNFAEMKCIRFTWNLRNKPSD